MPLNAPIKKLKPAPLNHMEIKLMKPIVAFIHQRQKTTPNWAKDMENPDILITALSTVPCQEMKRTMMCRAMAQASRICNKRVYEILLLLTGTVFAKSNAEFRELQAVFWAYKHRIDGDNCAAFNPIDLPALPDAIENFEAQEVATITTIQERSDELKRRNQENAMLRRKVKELADQGKAVEADLTTKLQAAEEKIATIEAEKAQLIEEKEQLKEALAAIRKEHEVALAAIRQENEGALAAMKQEHLVFYREATQIMKEAKTNHEEFRAMVSEKFIEKDEVTRMFSEAVDERVKAIIEQKDNDIQGEDNQNDA